MNESESQLYQIKGLISDLPPDVQAEVEKLAAQMREMANSVPGQMALALIGCEFQAANNP